jgi:tRNA(Ile)-lysidine synthetase-like protein
MPHDGARHAACRCWTNSSGGEALGGGVQRRTRLPACCCDLCVRLAQDLQQRRAAGGGPARRPRRAARKPMRGAGTLRRCVRGMGIPFFAATCGSADATPRMQRFPRMRCGRRATGSSSSSAPGDLLLLAHQREDQAETVLLRLLRGAGVAGLAGMPRERACGRARLCRPLLETGRAQLRAYAEAEGLRWVEDPSNHCPDYDRNYLRLRVMPLLAARWPGAVERGTRRPQPGAGRRDLCRTRRRGSARVRRQRSLRPGLPGARDRWRALGAARATSALRAWLARRGAGWPDARTLADAGTSR